MQQYFCHKIVEAAKLTGIAPLHVAEDGAALADLYSDGETVATVTPEWLDKHNPEIGGYFVRYEDGYESYSPAEPFEKGYSPCMEATNGHDLTFGEAIDALKAGYRVARTGWNGKGMYLWLLPAAQVKAEWCREPHLKAVAEANGGEIECLGSIRMYTVNAEGRRAVLTGWLASQTDMLSEDWMIME